jgi:hypothetical protein
MGIHYQGGLRQVGQLFSTSIHSHRCKWKAETSNASEEAHPVALPKKGETSSTPGEEMLAGYSTPPTILQKILGYNNHTSVTFYANNHSHSMQSIPTLDKMVHRDDSLTNPD